MADAEEVAEEVGEEAKDGEEGQAPEDEAQSVCISNTGVESIDSFQVGLDSICDKNLKQNFIEYRETVKQIERQNKVCQDIKDNIAERCCNQCRSECEEREIRVLRCCLEKENLKLSCLMQQAMRIQAEDPDRNWKEVPIATTLDEDFMPTQMSMDLSKRLTDAICNKSDICTGISCDPCKQTYAQSSSSCSSEGSVQNEQQPNDDVEDFLKCLLRQGEKQQDPSPCGKMSTSMIKNVLGRMTGGGKPGTPYQSARSSKIKELERQKSAKSFVSDRDRTIQCMQRKLNEMQSEVSGMVNKRNRLMSGNDTDDDQGRSSKNIKALEKTINRMQKSVEYLKDKLLSVDKGGPCKDRRQSDLEEILPPAPRTRKTNELKQLREAYNSLKLELNQKNLEVTDMKKRMKPLVYRSAAGTDNIKDAVETVDKSELMVLRAKKNELEEEQEEFKCLIREQAEQLDDYRRKYMEAQQKYEEQKVIIEKMDMNNKRIEEQINSEVQRIKFKFQEKIAELSQYPCILESEQLKLSQVTKEKDDLEGKLKIICKELKAMQAQKESTERSSNSSPGVIGSADCTEALRKCKIDYGLLEKQHMELLKEKEKITDQLQKTKTDLETLRTESAKIIARTKERAECTRHSLQEHVDRIEKELAQCRANACLSISDREEVIKEMQGQMNTLSFSFDAAQKQIKTLKTQIGFLSNDNTYPVKS